jgi:hypothetical protein
MSEIDDLIQLWMADPAEVERILRENPAIAQRLIEMDDIWKAGEAVSVDGFRKAYQEFYGRPMPYVDEPVAEEFVWAYHNKKGVVFEAWRGFGKSTFFAAWCPYVMGVNPVGSTALVRVNDQKAKEMGKTIADLIMTNPGWAKLFPHVIPDEKAGWSVENGFNVMDTRVTGQPGSQGFDESYARWRMSCFANHLSEKSLVCAGIESGIIIGLHPTNGMWFDDLHDEANTRSQAEMKKIVDILEGNIIPTWFSAGGSPTLGVFCTPWSENPPDAYQVMLKTGLFKHLKMPIFVEDPNGVPIPPTTTSGEPIDSEWVGKTIKPTWPEVFPVERIADMIKAFKSRFGQMALLNVELSKPKNMRYQEFPHKEIKWDQWPMTLGVDPVGWVKGVSNGEGISHFAGAQLLKTPYNTLVIGGGFVEKIDALEGEKRVADVQRTFARTYQNASIELNGAGAMWIALITRSSKVRYHGHNVNELGKGNKKDRQYRFLQPLFAAGVLQVSDEKTEFLDAVREYLETFPNMENDSHLLDVGDAICMGVLDVPEVWTKIIVHDGGEPEREDIWTRKRKSQDPWVALLEGRR